MYKALYSELGALTNRIFGDMDTEQLAFQIVKISIHVLYIREICIVMANRWTEIDASFFYCRRQR